MRKSNNQSDTLFLSFSDIYSGMLFIFILILVYYIAQFNNKSEELTKPYKDRADMLEVLKQEIEKHKKMTIHIDKNEGILRLTDDENCNEYFKSGKYELTECGKDSFRVIRGVLIEILPCYSHKVFQNKCNHKILKNKNLSKIDTILIEGHTDNLRVKKLKDISNNFDLSTERSRHVFQYLLSYREEKETDHGNELFYLYNNKRIEKNIRQQKLFGVSGFGRLRNVSTSNEKSAKQRKKLDRRIDIRFIMMKPEIVVKSIEERYKQKRKNNRGIHNGM